MRSKLLHVMKIILQTIVIFGISELGGWMARWTGLPIPGGLIGLVLLFAALQTGVIKLTWVETGGNWLIGEMLMFFVPSAVGMITFGSLLLHQGIQIVLAIAVSTALVMLSTGVIAEQLKRHRQKKQPEQKGWAA